MGDGAGHAVGREGAARNAATRLTSCWLELAQGRPRPYKEKMGWEFPWVSSGPSEFNVDFAVFTEEERRTGRGWNFGTPKHADEINILEDEIHGMSAFVLEDGVVYHSYSTYDRGTDVLNGTLQLLDRVPKGRENGKHPDWPRRRYEYEDARSGL